MTKNIIKSPIKLPVMHDDITKTVKSVRSCDFKFLPQFAFVKESEQVMTQLHSSTCWTF